MTFGRRSFAAIAVRSTLLALIAPFPLAASAQRAAGQAAGVDRTSVRSAAEPAAAVSFALDPRAQTPEGALSAIAQHSSQKGMKLTLLRVVP